MIVVRTLLIFLGAYSGFAPLQLCFCVGVGATYLSAYSRSVPWEKAIRGAAG